MATSACSNPTPTVRTPARFLVHSAIASRRSIWAVSAGDRNRLGRPTTASGIATTATSQPDRTATNAPALRLYECAGFAPTGETQPLPSDPRLVELRMTRRVAG